MQFKGIIDKVRNILGKSTDKDFELPENPTLADEAENIAKIVDDGVTNGNFSKMNARLANFNSEPLREKTVFEDEHKTHDIAICIIMGFFTLILLFYIVDAISDAGRYSVFRTTAIVYIICFLLLCLINVKIIRNVLQELQFEKRYQRYYPLMKYKRVVLTPELADYAGVSISTVVTDITNAIKQNLLPQGYFGKDNEIIILSNQAYREYMHNKAAYDQYYGKVIEEYKRTSERPEEIQKILDEGQVYINQIHADNTLIKDKYISSRLDEMEQIVTVIFNEVDVDPSNADKLGLLLSYYLPTTEKLLHTYIDLEEQHIRGKNADKIRREIASSLNNINGAFHRILDNFFVEKAIDVSSDIDTMSAMMQQEGLVDDQFANTDS